MSAFMVLPIHVAAMVRWYVRDPYAPNGLKADGGVEALADQLHRENALSVNYQYSNYPAELPHRFSFSEINRAPELSPVQMIKACNCLAYQSCEHPGWEGSDAKKVVDDMRSAAIARLPGYDEAPWSIDSRADVSPGKVTSPA